MSLINSEIFPIFSSALATLSLDATKIDFFSYKNTLFFLNCLKEVFFFFKYIFFAVRMKIVFLAFKIPKKINIIIYCEEKNAESLLIVGKLKEKN